MKKISFILLVFFPTLFSLRSSLFAQSVDDALRYSDLNLIGSARYLGMGGAFGAVGADISTLSSNPAGIALFKNSIFTFTPTFSEGFTKSDYLGETNSNNKYNVALGNIGLVLTSKNILNKYNQQSTKNDQLTFQFGFAMNRYNDFNNRLTIMGSNNSNSLMADYVNNADNDGFTPAYLNPYDTQLAYEAHLIKPNSPTNTLYSSPLYTGNVKQLLNTEYSGSVNEPVITFGANYNDKLYIGLSLGCPFFNYTESSYYSETNLSYNKTPNDTIKNFNTNTNTTDNGSGFNVKFGVIYRINDWIRLGAAVHSPTFYSINRTYTNEIQSNVNGAYYDVFSPSSNFSYSLQTPAEYLGSIAFIIQKRAVIDVDYEYIDYSTMMLQSSSDGTDYSVDNNYIQSFYTHQHNLRVGGEYRIQSTEHSALFIRAGFGISTSPYSDNNFLEQKNISVGFGFRANQFSFDVGYMYSFYNQNYYLYSADLFPSDNTITKQLLSFTFGFKF